MEMMLVIIINDLGNVFVDDGVGDDGDEAVTA